MNPAPAPANTEQLRHLIPSPIPEGTLPGAPSPIDHQSYAMRGIISRRTALMDTLVRGRMKPEDQGQSSDTARSLLELTAVLSHERATNLPQTPEGQIDPLDRAVGLLTGSFTHPPVPNPDYSYALQIYDLLPDSEKPKDALEIQRMFTDDLTEVGEARRAGKSLTKDQKRKAAYSSLRMICLLGSPEHGLTEEEIEALPSLMAGIIRDNHLGEEIGEAVGMKFGGRGEVKTSGLEKGKIPLSMLLDEQGFPKAETEETELALAHIKKTMLVGEGVKPLRMQENLATLRDQQRKDLSLAKIVEQIRSPGDLRVLATNGQISIYALRIPHPRGNELMHDFDVPHAYLNLVIAVGPHCAPVVLKDSSLQEGYAPNEPQPEKYEEGHYHNYFEELDRERAEYSMHNHPDVYPTREEGIFSFVPTSENVFSTHGKYLFISNDGKIVESPESGCVRMSDKRLPSGENVFYFEKPHGGDNFVKFDQRKKAFTTVAASTGCDDYLALSGYGVFIRSGRWGNYWAELVFIDNSEREAARFALEPDLYYYSSYRSITQRPSGISQIDISSNKIDHEKEFYPPESVVIVNDQGNLLLGYASRRMSYTLHEIPSKFDPQTRTITFTSDEEHRSFLYENSAKVRFQFQPGKEDGIGWWLYDEPQIFDEPAVKMNDRNLHEIIFRRLTKEADVLSLLQSPESASATLHPDQMTDVISQHLSDKLDYYLTNPDQAREYLDLYQSVKPALIRVINSCLDDLRRQMVPLKVPSDEAQELYRRVTELSYILRDLPE